MHRPNKSQWRAATIAAGSTVAACALFFVSLLLLDSLKSAAPWASVREFDFTALAVLPVGIAGINGVILLVEAFSIGWERSALKRVLFLETPTARNDLFYLLLRLSGFNYLFSFLMSFGLVFVLARQLGVWLDVDLLAPVTSPTLQFLVVAFVNTFVFYWAHRLMHTAGLFEIHKVHHSALELNVLTPTRNHPVDFMIMLVINTVPASLLGASPLVVTAWLVLNGLYQCAVHSEITWLEHKWIRALIITPRAHKVHHSRLKEHFDRNFGILTLWDRIFGTYLSPAQMDPPPLGVHDDTNFNTDRPLRELIGVLLRWIRGLLPSSNDTLQSGNRNTNTP